MIDLKGVQNNLEKLIGKEYTSLDWSENIYDDIVIAWEDYEYNGENQVVISNDGEYHDPPFLSTYINEKDSPEFTLYIEREIYYSEEYEENIEKFTITKVERYK